MRSVASLGLAASLFFAPSDLLNAQVPLPTILNGACGSGSHLAEGPAGADLTKRQARFFCDSAVVSVNPNNGDVMFQFSEKASQHQRVIGFAGGFDKQEMLTVERVYLEPGKAIVPQEGYCRLFFKSVGRTLSDIKSIACGAKIDRAGRRIVPVVVFTVY